MQQTPAHDQHNPDLLALMPADARRVIDVGCSVGALAQAYRVLNPHCDYVGIEIEPNYAAQAARFCTSVITGDVEKTDDPRFEGLFPSDCWVFGDSLEHLRDPWLLLRRIRERL